jgi:hypothetical protein
VIGFLCHQRGARHEAERGVEILEPELARDGIAVSDLLPSWNRCERLYAILAL